MITIDDVFCFTDDLVMDKIFSDGNYMTMQTNLPSLVDVWQEMGRWKQITKTKFSKHQWVEEWIMDDWTLTEKGIKVFYPIGP